MAVSLKRESREPSGWIHGITKVQQQEWVVKRPLSLFHPQWRAIAAQRLPRLDFG
jgi:hypothetical protein